MEGGQAWGVDGFKAEMCLWDASWKWQRGKCHLASHFHLPITILIYHKHFHTSSPLAALHRITHYQRCLFISFALSFPSAHLSRLSSLSLCSMSPKATTLCIPLPLLLRRSTPHCQWRPAPRWMTERGRRSWRSTSDCRQMCRDYGKRTNSSGWDMLIFF